MAEHKTTIEGFDASDYKVGIVTAQFNTHITKPMLEACMTTLQGNFKVIEGNIKSVHVAGSADIPAVLEVMACDESYDALIALGAVIRGETAHFDYVSKLVTEGIREIQVKHGIAIGFGVIMCDTEAQAIARIGLGAEFAEAALTTAKAIKSL